MQRDPLADLNHAILDRGFKQLRRIRHAHFLHHGGAMCFDRLHADLQALGDLSVFQASPDQLKNLLFAIGQRLRPFASWKGFASLLGASLHVCSK